jgi:hypothetical protein
MLLKSLLIKLQDMKPTKNKVFCKNCDRTKMLFETERKADNFIKFNSEEIHEETGYSPQRSYYCLFCGGWHVTSLKEKMGLSKKEQLFEEIQQQKKGNPKEPQIQQSVNAENQEKYDAIRYDLENQLKEMGALQKEIFLNENTSFLKKEIELLNSSGGDKEKLKTVRQTLEIVHILKKQNGFQKNNQKMNKEDELEEWRLWLKKNGY